MKRFRQSLANLLEQGHTAAQRDIPAGNIIDQVRPRTLPPATAGDRGGVVLSDDTPVGVGAAAAAAGTDTPVSRADHAHAPLNDLLALEGLSSTGLAARTATDTWALRTITGTANRITITNGSGAAGDPAADISTSYVGQSSITTLGTIGTGVWQGTKIGLAYGGSNADLSATGGANQVVRQNSAGGAFTVSVLATGDIPALDASKITTGEIPRSPMTVRGDLLTRDASAHVRLPISVLGGRYLRSDGFDPSWHTLDWNDLNYSGLTAGQVPRATSATAVAFGALDLANSNAVTGLVGSANGGTGVGNGGRTITINTNNAAFTFSAASKTLTIAKSIILDGVDGKTLTLNVDATIDSGTYTPTYEGSTTAGTTTYSAQQGSWWRFGQAIFFTITLAWTGATGTGQVRILLPFTAANVTNQNAAANLYHTTVTFANGSVVALISQNSNLVRLFSPATNANGTELAIEAAGTLAMSGCFFI